MTLIVLILVPCLLAIQDDIAALFGRTPAGGEDAIEDEPSPALGLRESDG